MEDLSDDAGDAAAQRFFAEYLDLLPTRVSKVIGGLTSGDVVASRDALVSMRVTSATAGAVRMEHYCRQLEARLAVRELPDAAAVLAWMSKASRLILHEAGASLGPLSATPRLLGSASIVVDQQSPGLASSDRTGEACPGPVFRLRLSGSEDDDLTRVGAD